MTTSAHRRSALRRAWTTVGTLAVLATAVAPVWTTEVLPTGDGPSHVYNAWVANALDEVPALGEVYALGPLVRPQLMADTFLRVVGPVVGWETSERLLATLIVLLGLAALLAPSGARDPTALALLVWIPAGWFLWMGFYDFSVGLVFFVLLSRSLERAGEGQPHLWMAGLLASHLFLTACGCVLLAGRWLVDRTRAAFIGALAWSAVTVVLLLSATPGGNPPGTPAPNGWVHVLMSDAVIGHDPLGVLAGMCVSAMAVAGAVSRFRRRGWLRVVGWIAIAFVFGSLVVPEWIGRGGYVPTRMRAVGLVLLVPPGIAALWRRPLGRLAAVVAGLVAWGVLIHQGVHTRAYAARLAETVRAVDRAVDTLGGAPGGMALVVRDPFQQEGFGRVFAYERIPERIAIRRGWPVLDDYEAGEPVFRVRWRGGAPPLSFALADGALAVRGSWTGPLYVVHDVGVRLDLAGLEGAAGAGVGSVDAPPFTTAFIPARVGERP